MRIAKKDRIELAEMTKDYYKQLTAPMDDMYDEGIIPSYDFYQISIENGICGFFAMNDEKTLIQFYLKESERENEISIFDEIIELKGIKKALSYTNDPQFYAQCLRKASSKEHRDFMFHEAEAIAPHQPFENILMEAPKDNQLEEILLYFKGIGMAGDWLRYYLMERIDTKSILLFRYKDIIIGTGEMRPSKSSAGYANVGMTVSSDYRGRGLGRYILSTMRKLANESGLKAICSTDHNNTASYNTILKSGFTCYHNIEEILF